MDKAISTYEELYSALLSLDNKHIMYKKDDACFCIKLDEEYDITIYNNRDGEVYLEYNAKGKQLTHYHPDYKEAYEDLADVIRNPEKELERLKKDAEASKKATYGWGATILILIALLLVAAWLFSGEK
ncbi:MAG: hypothetical protein ACI4EF_11640 [Coprococcus sp.]